jgi:hypothetical protein
LRKVDAKPKEEDCQRDKTIEFILILLNAILIEKKEKRVYGPGQTICKVWLTASAQGPKD